MILRGRYVLTSAEPSVIPDGAIRFTDGRISDVGTSAHIINRFPSDSIVGSSADLILPGMLNCHGHFSEALLPGIGKQLKHREWVKRVIEPVGPFVTFEAAYVGTLIAGSQMLLSGTTLVNDMFMYEPNCESKGAATGVVRALDDLGMRGIVSFGAKDANGRVGWRDLVREHEMLAVAAADSHFSRFRVGISAIDGQSPPMLRESARMARSCGGSHIHLHESLEEIGSAATLYGVRPIEIFARIGLLEAPTLAAHCNWIDEREISLLARCGVGVAHNPVSNMILGSGVCPVRSLRQEGVNIGIGTDGAGSNDRQDMLEAVKTAALLHRVHLVDGDLTSAEHLLHDATIGGARALRVEDDVGSIEIGKAADFVVLDGKSPALANIHNPVEAVVFAAGPREVKEVWVAGMRSVAAGQVCRVNIADVVSEAQAEGARLVQQAGYGRLLYANTAP